jgi:hypothetical protein
MAEFLFVVIIFGIAFAIIGLVKLAAILYDKFFNEE